MSEAQSNLLETPEIHFLDPNAHKDKVFRDTYEYFGRGAHIPMLTYDGQTIPLLDKKDPDVASYSTRVPFLSLDMGENGSGVTFLKARKYWHDPNMNRYRPILNPPYQINKEGKVAVTIDDISVDADIFCREEEVPEGGAIMIIPYAVFDYNSKRCEIMAMRETVKDKKTGEKKLIWRTAGITDLPTREGAQPRFILRKLIPLKITFDEILTEKTAQSPAEEQTPGPTSITAEKRADSAPPRTPSPNHRFKRIAGMVAGFSVAAAAIVGGTYQFIKRGDSGPSSANAVDSASSSSPSSTPVPSVTVKSSAAPTESFVPTASAIPTASTAPTASAAPTMKSIAPAPPRIAPIPQPSSPEKTFPNLPPYFGKILNDGFTMRSTGVGAGGQVVGFFKGLYTGDKQKQKDFDRVAKKLNMGSAAYYIMNVFDKDPADIQAIRNNSNDAQHALLARLEKRMGQWETWGRTTMKDALGDKKDLKDTKGKYLWTGEEWNVQEAKDFFETVLAAFKDYGWSPDGNQDNVKAGTVLKFFKEVEAKGGKKTREYHPLIVELAKAAGISLPVKVAMIEPVPNNNVSPGIYSNPATPKTLPTNTVAPRNTLDEMLKEIDEGWGDKSLEPSVDTKKTQPSEPLLIPGSGQGDGPLEYNIDVSEHNENPVSAISQSGEAELATANTEVRLKELLKVKSSIKRSNTLFETGEIAVPENGTLFETISACVGLENPDISEAAIAEYLRQYIKLSDLKNYDFYENGGIYVKLRDNQLQKLRALVGRNPEGPGNVIAFEDIRKACDVPGIRNCVRAVAQNLTKPPLRMAA